MRRSLWSFLFCAAACGGALDFPGPAPKDAGPDARGRGAAGAGAPEGCEPIYSTTCPDEKPEDGSPCTSAGPGSECSGYYDPTDGEKYACACSLCEWTCSLAWPGD